LRLQSDNHIRPAIVTGGAKGIGRAIVDRLQASGAGVWVWDSDEVRIHGARSSIVDIARPEQISKCLAEAGHSRIDILINDAVILVDASPSVGIRFKTGIR